MLSNKNITKHKITDNLNFKVSDNKRRYKYYLAKIKLNTEQLLSDLYLPQLYFKDCISVLEDFFSLFWKNHFYQPIY